ncbi:hypothetical protein [Streptomyces lincolnensis]|uniref:hypothetical protein n=1 Tax=Streptomyces lincolnensis TaxID=1915 RepID=UPI0037D76ACF
MAALVLHDLVPGDTLRVTGHFRLPRTPGEPMWLDVTELASLRSAPDRPADPADAVTAMLERYGPYVCVLDADTEQVPVWTETGAWVGIADTVADLSGLLDAYEQHHGVGGE